MMSYGFLCNYSVGTPYVSDSRIRVHCCFHLLHFRRPGAELLAIQSSGRCHNKFVLGNPFWY